jgi:hypothetical protein
MGGKVGINVLDFIGSSDRAEFDDYGCARGYF